jgi:hypothetical protein
MLYEGVKQKSTIVIMPRSVIGSMQPGGLGGLTALTMGLGKERAIKDKAMEGNALPLDLAQKGHIDCTAAR